MSIQPAVSIQQHAEYISAVVNLPQLKDVTLDKLHADVASAAAQHPKLPVILDLTQVNYVPSMALGTLVMLMRQLKNSNQRFVLVGLQPEVRTVLAITRLDKLFEIHPTMEAALGHSRGTAASNS
jgi:anti-anti-sigma factor